MGECQENKTKHGTHNTCLVVKTELKFVFRSQNNKAVIELCYSVN